MDFVKGVRIMSKGILTISDRLEAKQFIGWPCIFSDEYYPLYNLDMEDVTVGILRCVKDEEELPFFGDLSMDYGYRYCLPIDRECISEVEKLEKRFNLKQIYAAIKYRMEVTNVQE